MSDAWQFVLGNIDKKGNLENGDSLLDNEAKKKLKSGDKEEQAEANSFLGGFVGLGQLGISKADLAAADDNEDVVIDNSNAQDFEDIDELADDEEEFSTAKKSTDVQLDSISAPSASTPSSSSLASAVPSVPTIAPVNEKKEPAPRKEKGKFNKEDLFPTKVILAKARSEKDGHVLRFTELFGPRRYKISGIAPFLKRQKKKKKTITTQVNAEALDSQTDDEEMFPHYQIQVSPEQFELMAQKYNMDLENILRQIYADVDLKTQRVDDEPMEEKQDETVVVSVTQPVGSFTEPEEIVPQDKAEALLHRTLFFPLDQYQWEEEVIWEAENEEEEEEQTNAPNIGMLSLNQEQEAAPKAEAKKKLFYWGTLKEREEPKEAENKPVEQAKPAAPETVTSTNVSGYTINSTAPNKILIAPSSVSSGTNAPIQPLLSLSAQMQPTTAVPPEEKPVTITTSTEPAANSVIIDQPMESAPSSTPGASANPEGAEPAADGKDKKPRKRYYRKKKERLDQEIATAVANAKSKETANASIALASSAMDQIQIRQNSKFEKVFNEELLAGDWDASLIWDDTVPPLKEPNTKLIVNLNDPYLMTMDKEETGEKAEETDQNDLGIIPKSREALDDPSKNVYNVSHDREYEEILRIGGNQQRKGRHIVKHSLPALRLDKAYFKTHIPDDELRRLHRTRTIFRRNQVLPVLYRTPKKEKKNRRKAKYIERPSDLSANHHRVVLMEYVEQNPPLLNNVGMATKICNYFKMSRNDDQSIPKCDDGIPILVESQEALPLLGTLKDGEFFTSTENSMYSAQLFKQRPPTTDFLITTKLKEGKEGTSTKFYIREIPLYYTVGHTQPHSEVPAPCSRPSINFIKNRLALFIYRQFKNQQEEGQVCRLKIDDIKAAFPGMSETSIRKRLKETANFQRGGDESGWWTAKPDLKIPSEEELQLLVTPEMVCKNESMLAGQLRLDDCGITAQANMAGFAVSFAKQNPKIRDTIRFIEREGMRTPWNKSTNFINAVDGKEGARLNLLDVATQNLKADEMERLSAQAEAAMSNSEADNILSAQSAALAMTDQEAKKVLLEKGMSEERVKKMTKADRKLAARKMLDSEKAGGLAGNNSRKNAKEIIKNTKFREVLLQIFCKEAERLNKGQSYLEEDSDERRLFDIDFEGKSGMGGDLSDEDNDEMLDEVFEREFEMQLEAQNDEQDEDEDLKRSLGIFNSGENVNDDDSDSENATAKKKANTSSNDNDNDKQPEPKKKYIVRKTVTVTLPDGSKQEKTEIIREPHMVDYYKKKKEWMESSKNKKKHKLFMSVSESDILQTGSKERRRLQDQYRRYKKLQEEQKSGSTVKRRSALVTGTVATKKKGKDKAAPKKPRKKPEGAATTTTKSRKKKPAASAESSAAGEKQKSDHVTVEGDGKKIKIKKDALKEVSETTKPITIKVNKDLFKNGTSNNKAIKRKASELMLDTAQGDNDYLSPKPQAKRRRKTAADEVAQILHDIWLKLWNADDKCLFRAPVDAKMYPEYKKIITKPMDLSAIQRRIKDLVYLDHKAFLEDVKLMADNAHTFCRETYPHIPPVADRLVKICEDELKKVEQKIIDILNEPATPKVAKQASSSDDPFALNSGAPAEKKKSKKKAPSNANGEGKTTKKKKATTKKTTTSTKKSKKKKKGDDDQALDPSMIATEEAPPQDLSPPAIASETSPVMIHTSPGPSASSQSAMPDPSQGFRSFEDDGNGVSAGLVLDMLPEFEILAGINDQM